VFLVLTLGAVLLGTVALSLSSTFAGNWASRDRAPGGVLIGFAAPVPAHAPLLAENIRQPPETTATPSATREANGQEAGRPVPAATPPPPPAVSPMATPTSTASPTPGPTATVTSTATPTPSPTATATSIASPTPSPIPTATLTPSPTPPATSTLSPTPDGSVKPAPLLELPPAEDLTDGITDRKQLDCPKERPPRRPVEMSKHEWKKKLKRCGIDEEGNPLVAGSPTPSAATTFTVTGVFAAVY